MGRRLSAGALALACALCCGAAAPAQDLPAEVRAYLRGQPGWSPLGYEALGVDDRQLWDQYHPAQSPGVAKLDIDGDGRADYALALVSGSGALRRQKLVLLWHPHGRLRADTLSAPWRTSTALVVWRGEPGLYEEWGGDRKARVRHGSVIYEQMEAWAQAYYFEGGRIRRIDTSG
ncbi:MAG: hypothetical protein JSR45_03065 [Proteobacteria bacterium]|nr:hypothetical protein [Pseudomonadota bacterium]